eukprot:1321765-Amorphochlora_amoeboformis.AAC.1
MMEDLAGLRNAMADMLIATSKDFAMRAVPREWQYGAVGRKDLKKEEEKKKENVDAKEGEEAKEDVKEIKEEENPDEMAMRFENMTRWDDTDHPVCLWYPPPDRSFGFEGIDVLALNQTFLRKFIDRNLVEVLKYQGMPNLDRDWREMR